MSSDSKDFKFETYQEYWGSADQVSKVIKACDACGKDMIFSHLPDYKNLVIQEAARCPHCGECGRSVYHIIN